MRFDEAVRHVRHQITAAWGAAPAAPPRPAPDMRTYAEPAAPSVPAGVERPQLKALGGTGTSLFAGYLAGADYNPDLRGERGLAVWERMFNDGTARAVERAVTLPIRAAQLSVEPASDSPRHREMAERAERMLFALAPTWERTLFQALRYLRYGYYLFEKVWAVRDGEYVIESLDPRPPKTILRWFVDERGRPAGVRQRVWVPAQFGFGTLPTGMSREIDIPIERLLYLVNDPEGGDFTGESIGRPMYKHWFAKETLERILAIGVERREVGTEYAQLGPEASEQDARDMADILRNLHANAQGYILFPEKRVVETFGVFGQGGTRGNGNQLIEYHRREMAVSFLAEFLTLGSGATGSYALAKDKSSFFLLALRAVADYVADAITDGVIWDYIRVNFAGVTRTDCPRLRFSRIETRNMQEYAATIVSLIGAGALTADAPLREAIRVELDLPEEEEPEEAEGEPLDEGTADEEAPDVSADGGLAPSPDDPPNLVLSLAGDLGLGADGGLRAYAGPDPDRYEVTPDPASKIGYRVVDRSTGRRLSGFAAIAVVRSKQKQSASAGRAAASRAEAEGRRAATAAERERKKAQTAAERARKQGEGDRARAEKEAERARQAEEKDILSGAKGERDALDKATTNLDGAAAASQAQKAGWEPDGAPVPNPDAALDAARKAATANPDSVVSVVRSKDGYLIVKKPKTKVRRPSKEPANVLSRSYGDGGEGDPEEASYDSGAPDAGTLARLDAVAARLAPFLLRDRGGDADDGDEEDTENESGEGRA